MTDSALATRANELRLKKRAAELRAKRDALPVSPEAGSLAGSVLEEPVLDEGRVDPVMGLESVIPGAAFGAGTLAAVKGAPLVGRAAQEAGKRLLTKGGTPTTQALLKTAGETIGGAVGFQTGKQAILQPAQEAGLIEDVPFAEDLDNALEEIKFDLITPVLLRGGFKLAKGTFKAVGGALEGVAQHVDNILDENEALGRALTSNPKEFLRTSQDSIVEVGKRVRDILSKVKPNERGRVFGPMFEKVEKSLAPRARRINRIIDVGAKRLQEQGKDVRVRFDELLDASGLTERVNAFVPKARTEAIESVLQKESDNIAKHILSPEDFTTYKQAVAEWGRYEKKLGRLNLFRGTRAELDQLTSKELAKGSAAFNKMELARRQIENFEFGIDDLVKFKREYGKLGRYGAIAGKDAPEEVTKSEVYRDLEETFRNKIKDFMTEASNESGDLITAFENANSQFAALRRIKPLLDARQAEEVLGSGEILGGGASVAGRPGGGLLARFSDVLSISPQQQLAIAKGESALGAAAIPGAAVRVAGEVPSGVAGVLGRIEPAISAGGGAPATEFITSPFGQQLGAESLNVAGDVAGSLIGEAEAQMPEANILPPPVITVPQAGAPAPAAMPDIPSLGLGVPSAVQAPLDAGLPMEAGMAPQRPTLPGADVPLLPRDSDEFFELPTEQFGELLFDEQTKQDIELAQNSSKAIKERLLGDIMDRHKFSFAPVENDNLKGFPIVNNKIISSDTERDIAQRHEYAEGLRNRTRDGEFNEHQLSLMLNALNKDGTVLELTKVPNTDIKAPKETIPKNETRKVSTGPGKGTQVATSYAF